MYAVKSNLYESGNICYRTYRDEYGVTWYNYEDICDRFRWNYRDAEMIYTNIDDSEKTSFLVESELNPYIEEETQFITSQALKYLFMSYDEELYRAMVNTECKPLIQEDGGKQVLNNYLIRLKNAAHLNPDFMELAELIEEGKQMKSIQHALDMIKEKKTTTCPDWLRSVVK